MLLMLLNPCTTLSKHQNGWGKKQTSTKLGSFAPIVHYWLESVKHVELYTDRKFPMRPWNGLKES